MLVPSFLLLLPLLLLFYFVAVLSCLEKEIEELFDLEELTLQR